MIDEKMGGDRRTNTVSEWQAMEKKTDTEQRSARVHDLRIYFPL